MESQGGSGVQAKEAGAAEARALPFGHAPFSGWVDTRIEANGRVALPSTYKHAFTDGALLRNQAGAHLKIYTPFAFDRVVDRLEASRGAEMFDPRFRQHLYMSTPRVSVDKQGRLVVPPQLREAMGIEGETEIVLAGAIEALELWLPEGFAAEQAKFGELDLMFDTFSGLPTSPPDPA